MGIFAGSGVGKSILLGMIARYTAADVNVIAPHRRARPRGPRVPRGRPGPEGLARSVVVVATSDQPALMRMQAARSRRPGSPSISATGQKDVLSDDGFAHPLGHGPARDRPGRRRAAGHPRLHRPRSSPCCPSCWSAPARRGRGTITGFYTVLVEGDDLNEPIADAVRSILDGHVVLDRSLAEGATSPRSTCWLRCRASPAGQRPTPPGRGLRARRVLAAREAAQDLIEVGAYQAGTNPAGGRCPGA